MRAIAGANVSCGRCRMRPPCRNTEPTRSNISMTIRSRADATDDASDAARLSGLAYMFNKRSRVRAQLDTPTAPQRRPSSELRIRRRQNKTARPPSGAAPFLRSARTERKPPPARAVGSPTVRPSSIRFSHSARATTALRRADAASACRSSRDSHARSNPRASGGSRDARSSR